MGPFGISQHIEEEPRATKTESATCRFLQPLLKHFSRAPDYVGFYPILSSSPLEGLYYCSSVYTLRIQRARIVIQAPEISKTVRESFSLNSTRKTFQLRCMY
jgi:hypothetical protein